MKFNFLFSLRLFHGRKSCPLIDKYELINTTCIQSTKSMQDFIKLKNGCHFGQKHYQLTNNKAKIRHRMKKITKLQLISEMHLFAIFTHHFRDLIQGYK